MTEDFAFSECFAEQCYLMLWECRENEWKGKDND